LVEHLVEVKADRSVELMAACLVAVKAGTMVASKVEWLVDQRAFVKAVWMVESMAFLRVDLSVYLSAASLVDRSVYLWADLLV